MESETAFCVKKLGIFEPSYTSINPVSSVVFSTQYLKNGTFRLPQKDSARQQYQHLH